MIFVFHTYSHGATNAHFVFLVSNSNEFTVCPQEFVTSVNDTEDARYSETDGAQVKATGGTRCSTLSHRISTTADRWLFTKPHRSHGEKSTLNTVNTERTRSPLPRIHQSATCLCWPVTRRTTAAVHLDTFFQKKTFKDARSSAVNFKVIYRVCYLDLPVSYLWTVLFVFTQFSSGYEGDVRTSSWVNTGQEDAPLPPPHQI